MPASPKLPVRRILAAAGSAGLILALTASILPSTVSSASLQDPSQWGVNDDWGIAAPGYAGDSAYRLARDAGMGWVRYNFYWNRLNPAPGVFDWSESDRAVAAAAANGLGIYASILWAPAWTTGGVPAYEPWYCMDPATSIFTPNKTGCANGVYPDITAWRNFVSAAVTRYRGQIRYWGFGNEFSNPVFWRGGDVLARRFLPAYAAAKAADPNALIVGPDSDYAAHLAEMLQAEENSGQRVFDVIAFHSYGRWSNPDLILGQMDSEFKPVLDRYGRGRLVWLTESGIAGGPDQLTLDLQGVKLQTLYRGIAARPWLNKFFLYRLAGDDYGLLTNAAQPKPAYSAVRAILAGQNPPPVNPPGGSSTAPNGSLDRAACDLIGGWTYDPARPDQSIEAHIYIGGPAGSGAVGYPVRADSPRADVNNQIGIGGQHGFTLLLPSSYRDGRTYDVYAYGINSAAAGPPALLAGSPRSFRCDPPPPPVALPPPAQPVVPPPTNVPHPPVPPSNPPPQTPPTPPVPPLPPVPPVAPVSPPTVAAPTVAINAGGQTGSLTLAPGRAAVVSWRSENTDGCAVNPGNFPGMAGSLFTGPLTADRTYTVNCTGPGGRTESSVRLIVSGPALPPPNSPAPPAISPPNSTPVPPPAALPPASALHISVNANGQAGFLRVIRGQAAVVSWSSANADSCRLDPGGYPGLFGSLYTGPLQADRTYAVQCEGPSGRNAASVKIEVGP